MINPHRRLVLRGNCPLLNFYMYMLLGSLTTRAGSSLTFVLCALVFYVRYRCVHLCNSWILWHWCSLLGMNCHLAVYCFLFACLQICRSVCKSLSGLDLASILLKILLLCGLAGCRSPHFLFYAFLRLSVRFRVPGWSEHPSRCLNTLLLSSASCSSSAAGYAVSERTCHS